MLWLPLDLSAGVDYAIGWISNPRRSKRSCLLQNRPDWLWDPSSLVFHGYWSSIWGEGVNRPKRGVDHFHLVPKLRMSGVLLLLPLHAFMLCTGTTLPSPLDSDFVFMFYTSIARMRLRVYRVTWSERDLRCLHCWCAMLRWRNVVEDLKFKSYISRARWHRMKSLLFNDVQSIWGMKCFYLSPLCEMIHLPISVYLSYWKTETQEGRRIKVGVFIIQF